MVEASFRRRMSRFMVAMFDMLLEWRERGARRRRPRSLSERALKDLVLSRSDAEREGRKPFWRA
ncbi:MAG: hypothetical protein IT564_00230 [Rhodospirillales bacterium]|nr:hypothetical protein [Rhodospirillales bacterium]